MNVLFLDSVHPILKERLNNAGYTCIERLTQPVSELGPDLNEAVGIVIRSRFQLNSDIFNKCPNLKFIARSGSGLENIDVKEAELRNIKIYNSPEGNCDAVAEHVIGMLLMLFNNLCRSDRQVRNGKWVREGNRGMELNNKTVGIIGYGHTGSALARKLTGFGCRIMAFDKYKSGFGTENIEESSMNELFDSCDIISFHLPLTEETRFLANELFFQSFKNPVCIVNSSRGPILNTADLVKAMQKDKIWGVCLDVLEYEETSFEYLSESKMPDPLKWLSSSDKAVLTPHIAGWTRESYFKLSAVLADKILADKSA